MFGIGIGELFMIFVVALLAIGPERLPKAAKTLAKLVGQFRRASDDVKRSMISIADEMEPIKNPKKTAEKKLLSFLATDTKEVAKESLGNVARGQQLNRGDVAPKTDLTTSAGDQHHG